MRVIHLRALYLSNATTSGRDILDLVYQHHDHWNQIGKIEIGHIPPADLVRSLAKSLLSGEKRLND